MKITALILSLLLSTSFSTATLNTWAIAKDFSLDFKTKKVAGRFTDLQGEIIFDQNDLANASFRVEVAVASIEAGNWLKTRHAKGKKWFDAKNFPTIRFVSTEVTSTKTGYLVRGNLTMHGITKVVTIPFRFENDRFLGSFEVNRLDYEVGTIKGMSKSVGTSIQIDLSVPVTSAI